MTSYIVKSLSRIAIMASLTFVGAGGVLVIGSEPAAALCKGVGAGRCIERDPMDKWKVKVNDTRLPDSNWVDPDCKYYGNCQSPFPPAFPTRTATDKPMQPPPGATMK